MTDRPGPGGPWPLDPQVPPYEQPPATPSYFVPSQPYSPPQPPTYPTQAPSFVPAGQYYQAQPYQGQPYAGQPYAGQPYAPPPGTQPPYGGGPGSNEPDRVPVKYGVMVVVAVVLLAVIGVGVAVWSMSSTPKTTAASVWTAEPTATATRSMNATPSSKPSPSMVGNCSGSSAETPDWRAVVPAGWTCTYEAGNEVTIVNDAHDAIMVRATDTPNATVACSTELARDAKVTALPDSAWGGRVSKTAGIVYQGFSGQARCVNALGYSYVMVGMVINGTLDQIVAGETALAQSWVWKA